MTTPSGAFTDKNVQELKDALPLIETYGRWLTNRDKVEALLHRLECAEAVIKAWDEFGNVRKAEKAWKRAKGE